MFENVGSAVDTMLIARAASPKLDTRGTEAWMKYARQLEGIIAQQKAAIEQLNLGLNVELARDDAAKVLVNAFRQDNPKSSLLTRERDGKRADQAIWCDAFLKAARARNIPSPERYA